MQPYFFPYLGHFSLIKNVDLWIVFDITQYTPKSWMSRNRVLHPNDGTNWVGLPLHNSSIHIKIHEALVSNINNSRKSIIGKLTHYKKYAPYYSSVLQLVEDALSGFNVDSPSLVDVNIRSLELTCKYLGIEFRYKVCSDLNIEFPSDTGAGDWALEIASAMGADAYLNPISGKSIFDENKFKRRGIDLKFLTFTPQKYDTKIYDCIEGLSIIDVLMWNSPEASNEMLANGVILS